MRWNCASCHGVNLGGPPQWKRGSAIGTDARAGNPNGATALRRAGKGGAPLRAAIARNADRHARDLSPVVADIRSGGAMSLRAIAAELNARRHADAARRALARLDRDEFARPARIQRGAMPPSLLTWLVEAVANGVVGLLLAVVVFSILGLQASLGQNLKAFAWHSI
jgi:hypothetical protein